MKPRNQPARTAIMANYRGLEASFVSVWSQKDKHWFRYVSVVGLEDGARPAICNVCHLRSLQSTKARLKHQSRFKHYDSSSNNLSTTDSSTNNSGTTTTRFRDQNVPIPAPNHSGWVKLPNHYAASTCRAQLHALALLGSTS